MKRLKTSKNTGNSSQRITSMSETTVNKYSLKLSTLLDRGLDLENRIFKIVGDIDDIMFDYVDDCLTALEDLNKKAVTIRIHSEGGSIYSALAIVGRLKKSPCKIITEGYGSIMSAAVLILACANHRRISEYSWLMHHEASVHFEEGRSFRASELQAYLEQLKKEEIQWAKNMAKFTKKSTNFWLKEGVLIDKYFYASELLKLGVVDEII